MVWGTAESTPATPEQKTADYFALASPDEKFAFLLAMPKGGILDEDLDGAVYAESYIGWAAEKRLCIGQDMALHVAPCGKDGTPAKSALTNPELYRKTIDAWSMLHFNGNGRGHFFAAPEKFDPATIGRTGLMLAEAATRAAGSHALYIELTLAPDGGIAARLGKRLGWDGNDTNTLTNLKNNGIAKAPEAALKEMRRAEDEERKHLKCGLPDAAPGCKVSIRYLYKVERNAMPGEVFAQIATGFALASRPNSKFVGLVLTGAEDDPLSMRDFSLHMQMLDFLKSIHPEVHVAVDAGELTPGMVPPEGLSYHISEAVMLGHAERIGQGNDIVHEPADLPAAFAKKGVLFVMCPTRHETLLGNRHFPLPFYIQSGVPSAVSSCSPGILRSEISMEYLKASEQSIGYVKLKNMARNTLEYAFIPGKSLWLDLAKTDPVSQCAKSLRLGLPPSLSCNNYLDASEKANLQWQLEAEFRAFENQYQNRQAGKSSARRKLRAVSRRR